MYKMLLFISGIVYATTSGQLTAQTVSQYGKKSDDYYYSGRFDSAMRYARLMEPLIIDTFSKSSKEYGAFVGQYYSMIHEQQGHLDSARYWYIAGMDTMAAHGDTASLVYGEILTTFGSMLNNMGYYTEAYPYLKKGVAVLNHYQHEPDSYLGSINNLANYHSYCGEYFEALTLYQGCLDGIIRYPTRFESGRKGILLENMATIYTKIGNVSAAEKAYKEAFKFLRTITTIFSYYEGKKNLGQLYLSIGKTDSAEKIFTELCNDTYLNKKNGSNPTDNLAMEYVQALNGLGNVRVFQGKYEAAEALYRQSTTIAEKLENPTAIYSSLGSMAQLYTHTVRKPQADTLYERLFGLMATRKSIEHYAYLSAYLDYCENLIAMKQTGKAAGKIKQAGSILFADFYKNFPGMTEGSQLQYMLTLNRYRSLLTSTLTNGTNPTDEKISFVLNQLLQLKGMILTYQQRRLQSLRSSQDTVLASFYKKWQATRQMLYQGYTKGQPATCTDSLEEIANRYEQAIATKTGTPPEDGSTPLASRLAGHLHAGQAAIEYVRYNTSNTTPNQYCAFVLQPGKAPRFVQLCSETQLRRCFKSSTSKKFNTKNQLSNSRRLYNLVWKPVAAQLAGADTVYYSPEGLLNYLSFDALTNEKGRCLLQQKKLVQLSSLRSLQGAPINDDKPAAAVLWGNIDCSEAAYQYPAVAFEIKASTLPGFGNSLSDAVKGPTRNGFKPLPVDELPVVKKLVQQKGWPFTVYDSIKATEENFKQGAADFSGLLHISSHGFYAMKPSGIDTTALQPPVSNNFMTQVNPLLRCGLILNGANWVWTGKAPLPDREDGILTGYEIAMMDLSKVKLVVLSACETGLGDIDAGSEGVLGLQRAFKLAGVDKMVLSLWSVNAIATRNLMELFYQKLLNGAAPATALRNAKIEMAQKKPPYAWAGFVLVK